MLLFVVGENLQRERDGRQEIEKGLKNFCVLFMSRAFIYNSVEIELLVL